MRQIFLVLLVFFVLFLITGECRSQSAVKKPVSVDTATVTMTINLPEDNAKDLSSLDTEIAALNKSIEEKRKQYQSIWNAICKPQGVDPEKIVRRQDGSLAITQAGQGKLSIKVKK